MFDQVVTSEEIAAHVKGYGMRFDTYEELENPILIRSADYRQLAAWCEPYVRRSSEVQGALDFAISADGYSQSLVIKRVYVMGGNSESHRTTCLLDADDMLRQMQEHHPERTAFVADQVGWWHLHHAGQHASLSVGDVEECRQSLRTVGALDAKILHLLMYGDGRGGYRLSGYLVGMDEVYRLPVRILEDANG
jgi:hypothetical protein